MAPTNKFDAEAANHDPGSQTDTLAERRYAERYRFSASAEARDLDSGLRCSGQLTELSSGGCFISTREPLAARSRVMLRVTRENDTVEVLATVRAVKPGTGMGLEFLNIAAAHFAILQSWLAPLRA